MLDLDKPISGGTSTWRQVHEEVLANRDKRPQFAIKEAEQALTPPSIDPVQNAADAIGIGESGVEWVGIQFMMFLELSRQRARGQSVQPLSFVDIEAYQRLNTIQLHPVELSNILHLDRVLVEHFTQLAEDQMAAARNGK